MSDVTLRHAGPEDVEHVKWALYTAFACSPERLAYPFERVISDPQAVPYYRDWDVRAISA